MENKVTEVSLLNQKLVQASANSIGWAKLAARFTAMIYSQFQFATVLGCQIFRTKEREHIDW